MILYRIGSARHPANDGEGASLYGGRWNHKGVRVIYSAESRALCALEVLASANELANDYVVTQIEAPEDIAVEKISVEGLPDGWDFPEPTNITQDIGTMWVARGATAILVVPSAVIRQEHNYILNPAHPDFVRIQFYPPEPFIFDRRLGR